MTWLEKQGQCLTENQLNTMERFQEMVLSAPMNLTSITTNEDFTIKHFIDSLTLLPIVDKLTHGAAIVDIGTGAGFPGVPLKIARPSINITLMDSLIKRILFLRSSLHELGYADTPCVHARAEEYAKKNGQTFDVAIARAVARFDKLATYSLPLIKPGGIVIAMKGPSVDMELLEATPALSKLGGVVEEIKTVAISSEINHTIVTIRKQ